MFAIRMVREGNTIVDRPLFIIRGRSTRRGVTTPTWKLAEPGNPSITTWVTHDIANFHAEEMSGEHYEFEAVEYKGKEA